MTRNKIKLTFIPNDSLRRSTFNKRKKGLMKKAHELSVLCGIDVCAIIYGPYTSKPDIWPPNPLSVLGVVSKYNKIPELDPTRKKLNQESHLKQRSEKVLEQYNKQRRENREKELTLVMYNILNGQGLPNMNIEDFFDLIMMIDQNLKDIYTLLQKLGDEGCSSSANPGGVTEQPLLSEMEGNERKQNWN